MALASARASITEGDHALGLFTDRTAERRLFASYLNDDPPRNTILFVHGDGGNGKSLLLRLLRDKYTRRLPCESWDYVRALPDDAAFTYNYEHAQDYREVPYAYIDFAGQEWGEDRPRTPYNALMMLRRSFGFWGLRFPLFDFAIVLLLIKTHQWSSGREKDIFPLEELSFVTQLAEYLLDSKYFNLGKEILSVFNKHLKADFALYLRQRGLDENEVERLRRMDATSALGSELPTLFARDLNAAMQMPNTPPRAVLFIDTHEALWGTERDKDSTDHNFRRDEWLRRLLSELYAPNQGIVSVVAARELPLWPQAFRCPIAMECIDAQLVGLLERYDADDYLKRAGIDDATMRTALVDYAEAKCNQVHPLHLGLCADVVLAARDRGEVLQPTCFAERADATQKCKELIVRLLRYCTPDVEEAVKSLAAARAFDESLFHEMGELLHFGHSRSVFKHLTSFSFVRPDDVRRRANAYRIHDLLRRLLEEVDEAETAKAHEALEAHYRRRSEVGDRLALVEVIFHANRRDWQRGCDEWNQQVDAAFEAGNYAFCEALLTLRRDLRVEAGVTYASMSYREGIVALALSRYDAARSALEGVIATYDRAPCAPTQLVDVHTYRGLALHALGDLLAELGEPSNARCRYEAAVAAFKAVLELAPESIGAYTNQGLALRGLGNLCADRREHAQAERAYEDAIAACGIALRMAPERIGPHNNRGLGLQGLGELRAQVGAHAEASVAFKGAIAAFKTALRIDPNHIDAHNNLGVALRSLGELLVQLRKRTEARRAFNKAMAACESAVLLAPEHIRAHNNRGLTLQNLGELHAQQGQQREARGAYEEARIAFETTLRLAPQLIAAQINRGVTLRNLGELHAQLGEQRKGHDAYKEAIIACETVLRLAPKHIGAHKNRGLTLERLGELHAKLSKPKEARDAYKEAIIAFETALRLGPQDPELQASLARLRSRLDEME